ncbi:hypothetical protein D9M72_418510 [compost metagenome]
MSTAWPNSAIKPIAADTDSGMPVRNSANTPPISANGMFEMISVALLNDLNALNSSRKITSTDSGTTIDSRAMARSWFSNSPDQLILTSSALTFFATSFCMSLTTLPMSRSRMKMPIEVVRWPFSRLMFIAPEAARKVTSCDSGTCAPSAVCMKILGRLGSSRSDGFRRTATLKWRSPSHSSVAALPASAVSIRSCTSATLMP